jgi:predicted phosphate transport protein (TIGR00153 family)
VPFQVIPRELAFYELLDRAADNVAEGARELAALVDDLPNAAAHNDRIADLEHHGDDLTHEIIAKLNVTFVVPIDRGDIHRLTSHLDDVLDAIEGVADLVVLHGITEPMPQFRTQIQVLVRASTHVVRAIGGLRNLHTVERAVTDLKREEREGDWIYRRAVASLYSGEFRSLEVLMWKDLLKQVEAAVDRCEDIANTIESVATKFA